MKTTTEYLHLLKQYMQRHAAQYGITRMGIFGSVVRIKYELEALLGSPVDLVRLREHMDEFLKNDIEREALYA